LHLAVLRQWVWNAFAEGDKREVPNPALEEKRESKTKEKRPVRRGALKKSVAKTPLTP